MNYNNTELIDLLAAEYVLGTLKGAARKRFQRLMLTSINIREATYQWEQHLNDLSGSIKPIKPDEKVWHLIQNKIEPTPTINLGSKVVNNNASIWKTWSVVATAASILLAIVLLKPVDPIVEGTQEYALVQNEAEQPLWFINVRENGLSIQVAQGLKPITDKDYELWMIVKDQAAPISLGLLPKNGKVLLAKNNRFDVGNINLLAVSLEPLGGSPNGSPTELLHTAKLITL